MEAIIAQRVAPFNFSAIPGFPHLVPKPNEWYDDLPRFNGKEHDHPGEHLSNFHEYIIEQGLVHEDVLI